MRTIYIDSEFKCHTSNDGTMTAVEDPFFADKCNTFIEGYCYDTSKGYTSIYPWRDSRELEAAQTQYEQDLVDRADLEEAYNYLLNGGAV